MASAPIVEDSTDDPTRDLRAGGEESLAEPQVTAGFIEIEPVDYADRGGARRSLPARLFYSFFPADSEAKERPVFVFFNGGPVTSTTGLLHAFGTGPMTVASDPPSAAISANAASFTRLGNLLYIDARSVGFSYGLADDPSNPGVRELGLGAASMGPRLDAADFVRVVLRVLEREPALRNNRVVWVAESYGATRAAFMTTYLFGPQQLAAGGSGALGYTDEALAREIEAHYEAVFPDETLASIGPEVAARQFGSQVLIQPAFVLAADLRVAPTYDEVVTDCSEGSAMRRASEALGVACPLDPNGIDLDHLMKPAGWTEAVSRAAAVSMLDPGGFERRFSVPVARVVGLAGPQRSSAFRIADMEGADLFFPRDETSAWTLELGRLPEWDRYFINAIPFPDGGDSNLVKTGFRQFLDHAPWVKTLITDAFWDVLFPSRGIVPVVDQLRMTQGLDVTAAHDATPRDGEQRPGWLTLNYGPSFELAERQREVRVRMPLYSESPHTVTVTEGAELWQDVKEFFFPDRAAP